MRWMILIIAALLCFNMNAKTFTREYTYRAGEADSKITARAIALEQVKRLLLEEVGVYVQSSIQNSESDENGEVSSLTKTDVEVLSAGITETKVLSELWNGETYILKAEIQLDEKDVLKRLDDLINNEKSKKVLEDSRRITDAALSEIDNLRMQLEQEKDRNKQIELQAQYNAETDKLSASALYEKGSQAFNDGDYKQASIDLQKSVELDPTNKDCWFTLGIVHRGNANYGQAIECFEKYVKLDSLASIGWVELADVYKDKKEYDKAIPYYLKAIELDPIYTSAYIGLGAVYEAQAFYDEAIQCYVAMMENDEEPTFELERLAIVFGLKQDYDNSVKYYSILLKCEPKNLLVTMDLGEIYEKKGDYVNAVATYEKADVLAPDNIWVLNNLASAYYKMGDYEKGQKIYIRSAQLGDTEIQKWCDSNGINWRVK